MEYFVSFVTDNLIHFLARNNKDNPDKQLDIFKLIVEKGFRCSYEIVRFNPDNWFRNGIVCFTDIPLRECNEHTSIYGKFGIGVKKSFVKRVGGNPVSYFVDHYPNAGNPDRNIAARGALLYNLKVRNAFFDAINKYHNAAPGEGIYDKSGNLIVAESDLSLFVNTEIFCSSFYKQMGDLGPARDETIDIDLYYKEREWRVIPSLLADLVGLTKNDKGDIYIPFERKDVNMIVVPNEYSRMAVTNYLLSLKGSSDLRLNEFGADLLPVVNYDELHRW